MAAKTEDKSDEEGLQARFPIGSAGQQKVKPDQTGVMRLMAKAYSHAQDAGKYKPFLEKAPRQPLRKGPTTSPAVLPQAKIISQLARKMHIRKRVRSGA